MATAMASLTRKLMILCVMINIVIGNKICLPENQPAALFVFGDSLFEVGNNNFIKTIPFLQANCAPYGHTTFFKYATGRFSDGLVLPDFIAKYANLPLLPPYLRTASNDGDDYIYGANFASAGAGALVETRQGTAIDLKTQVSHFKQVGKLLEQKLGDAEAKALLSNAVYIFSIGGNDYSAPFLTTSSTVVLPYPQAQFVDVVIGNISSAIHEIYKEGGRKFGLLNVGPMNCFPIFRMMKNGSSLDACQEEEASGIARLHRKVLPTMLQKLEKQLEGFKYSLTDFYGALVEVMKYPSRYGFKEGEVACCGGGTYRGDYSCGGKRGIEEYELCENVNDYVYFDSIHPSEAAAQHFANLMWAGNNDFTHPYNLKQLFELR
ncbi:GDSL esterase/lipase 5-like [Neltuma alba]|uniref:GDSL esterase/lipase 5-like n=1 Tax=Neltuma alba TaxID=207710 RepID=UPI0010A4E4B1|nr:GDSL esterase/lipase 5-like [Prosopis alba]XP_028797207.1 GDSL esterase/lipase 5-like [Prosopis alba]